MSLLKVFKELVFSFKFSPENWVKDVLIPMIEKDQSVDKTIDQDYTEAINDMMANAAFIKPVLEEMGLLETVKNIDIDEITISIITPSVKTGYVHLIKVPGLTQVLNEKIFS